MTQQPDIVERLRKRAKAPFVFLSLWQEQRDTACMLEGADARPGEELRELRMQALADQWQGMEKARDEHP